MGDNITLTRQQAEQKMNTLRRLFTSVRLVHEGEKDEASAAVQEAFRTGKQVSRLEFVGDGVFQIMAEYVCVDGSPCVIETAGRNPTGSVVGTDGDTARESRNSAAAGQTAQERERDDKPDILIVEDNEMNRLLLSRILESAYTVHTAENGRQALEEIERLGTRLSIVLLDIIMPVMNGFDVLRAMNAGNITDDIPVIMISSDDDAETVRKAFSLGVSDFIGKPYNAGAVKQRVNNTIKLFAKQRRNRRQLPGDTVISPLKTLFE